MTAQAVTLDQATPTQFQIEFKRIPGVVFNAVRCTIPGPNLGTVEVPTPFKSMPFAGTTITHAPFRMDFILDENHANWGELLHWMEGIGFPEEFEQYAELEDSDDGIYSDWTVTIRNNQNNPVVRYHFSQGYPNSLSDIELDTQVGDVDPMIQSATFEYTLYRRELI